MATGDVTYFDQWCVDVQEKKHDHETDTFKVGLITSAVTPAATTTDPRWGAGGTINWWCAQPSDGRTYWLSTCGRPV